MGRNRLSLAQRSGGEDSRGHSQLDCSDSLDASLDVHIALYSMHVEGLKAERKAWQSGETRLREGSLGVASH